VDTRLIVAHEGWIRVAPAAELGDVLLRRDADEAGFRRLGQVEVVDRRIAAVAAGTRQARLQVDVVPGKIVR